MFYGDSVITPAISVLSAVEGLEVVSPQFDVVGHPIDARRSWSRCSPSSAPAPPASAASSDPIMLLWFVSIGGPRRPADRPPSGGAGCAVTAACRQLLRRAPGRDADGHGLGISRADGRRGALCGHGPFRASADPGRLVLARHALPRAELLRPGQPGTGIAGRDPQPVLPAGARMAATAAGVPCDRSDGHRFAGGHLRRVLDHQPGDQARLSAADGHSLHVRDGGGADLRSGGQLAAAAAGQSRWCSDSAVRRRSPRPMASRSPRRW